MLALAEAQERAVLHGAGPMLLLGPAGTGKSEALARRFARLADEGVAPHRILVLAANPAAARQLRRRVEAQLAGAHEELWIDTWASPAERLLREQATAVGLDPFFNVLGPAERLAILLDRIDELPLRNREIRGNPTGLLARLLEQIDEVKAGAQPPEPELAELIAAHDRLLAAAGSVDRGDLALMLGRLLDERPDVRGATAARFEHVMVDELEDTTAAQRAVLAGLARDNPNHLYALEAGGPETSLPAGPTRLREWALDLHPGATVVELDRRFRRPTIRRWRCANERAQAQAVAREAEHLIAGGAAP